MIVSMIGPTIGEAPMTDDKRGGVKNFLRRSQALVPRPMASDLRAVQRRGWLVAGTLVLGLGGLGLRSWNVAVAQHEQYAEQGNRQQLRSYKVKASRGDIVDRSYISLAVTDRVHKMVVNPRLVSAQEKTEEVVFGAPWMILAPAS